MYPCLSPAVKFQKLLAVLNKNVRHQARLVLPVSRSLQRPEDGLLVERDDELHVTEDEVRLVGHAGVAAAHPLLVSSQDALQVLDILIFRLLQLK